MLYPSRRLVICGPRSKGPFAFPPVGTTYLTRLKGRGLTHVPSSLRWKVLNQNLRKLYLLLSSKETRTSNPTSRLFQPILMLFWKNPSKRLLMMVQTWLWSAKFDPCQNIPRRRSRFSKIVCRIPILNWRSWVTMWEENSRQGQRSDLNTALLVGIQIE